MKSKILIIASLLFLLIVNTRYFWEVKLGVLAIPTTLFLFSLYITFIFILLVQVYYGIKEDFKNKNRIFCIGTILIVSILIYLKPFGIINFEKLESKDLLIAYGEGAANCSTTLKLKEDGKFKERNVCFGINVINGEYILKNDTIYFKNSNLNQEEKYFDFAVIKKIKIRNTYTVELVRYYNLNDSIGNTLWVRKNELKK